MNVKMKYTILILFTIITLVPFVSGEIMLEINIRDSFSLGETISYDYTITSDETTEATIMPYVECPTAPVPPIAEETISLTENVPYENAYVDTVVDDLFEPQTCMAYVEILNPIQKRVEKNFSIKTNPSFDFRIKLNKKIFIKNEEINIDYTSSVENPSITATLTYPNGKQEQVTLPTSLKASKIGTYEIEITASKQGYKTITKKEQFGVIKEEAEIQSASVCNGNNICDNNENYQNCPLDCLSGGNDNYCDKVSDGICDPDCDTGDFDCETVEKEEIVEKSYTWIILLLVAIVSIGVILIQIGLKRNKYEKQLLERRKIEEALELKNYIRNNLSRGYTEQHLRQELLKDGWDKKMVNKAFDTVKKFPK